MLFARFATTACAPAVLVALALLLAACSPARSVRGGSDSAGSDVGSSDIGNSDVGGSDVGGSDVGGSDVGGSDVGGSDVGGSDVGNSDVGSDAADGSGGDTNADVSDAGGDDTGADGAIADAAADTSDDTSGDTATGDSDGDGAPTGPSCKGKCFEYVDKATCQCDLDCLNFGDCCADFKTVCGCTDDSLCDDNNACTVDSCDKDAGVCNLVPKVCDDGLPCTFDACVAGACTAKPGNDFAPCNDSDDCTTSDVCKAGACKGGPKACDDGNPCTVDSCDASGGACVAKAGNNGAACDDADPCSVGDTCKDGVCAGGAKSCDDGNPCTSDGCDGKTGACVAVAFDDGGACDDGNACTSDDACKGGACKGFGKDCDDGNPCTSDTCDAKTQACGSKPAAAGAKCTDFNPCTEGDACKGDVCVGVAKVCNDNDACTLDACDKLTGGCTATASKDGTACDDGDACTTGTLCAAGVCAGKAVICDDGKGCTSDACDPKTGACIATVLTDGSACIDGKPCTTGDACAKGECKGTPKSCNDANPCTVDSCSVLSGVCSHAPIGAGEACDDGNVCTVGEVCGEGGCAGGVQLCALQPVWSEDVPCDSKVWTMNPAKPEPAVAFHVDGTPATVQAKTGACSVNFNNGKDYNDGSNPVAGTATTGPIVLPKADRLELELWSYHDVEKSNAYDKRYVEVSPDGFAKVALSTKLSNLAPAKTWTKVSLTLDALAGQKVTVRLRFDSIDGKTNTSAGWFVDDLRVLVGHKPGSCAGRCGEGAAGGVCGCDAACAKDGTCCQDIATLCKPDCKADGDCSDGAACTVDTCVSGACAYKAAKDGTVCDDGKACTVNDSCGKGACAGASKDCGDNNVCTLDACDPVAGCTHAGVGGGACEDGDPCTVKDVCVAGSCKAGGAKCNDGNPCTADSCDGKSGACSAVVTANGSGCEDGNPCTSGDRCLGSKCLSGFAKCSDGSPCTTDSCDALSGACSNSKIADGQSCNDGNACTLADACKGGQCVGAPGCSWKTLWQDDIECDSKGVDAAPDNKEPALGWHIDATPSYVKAKTGTCTLNYNNGKDYVGDGGQVVGRATVKAVVQLPKAGAARLRFWSRHHSEDLVDFDKRYVELSSDGFKANATVVPLDNSTGAGKWTEQIIDLNNYLGGPVQVRFAFDSVDDYDNTGAGWFIDDLLIEAGANSGACSQVGACDDGDACTTDSCVNGTCGHAAAGDGKACGDGNLCLADGVCKAGACAGKAKVCDDGGACTYDSCDPKKGCVFVVAASGATCDDGDVCSKNDVCNSSTCKGVAKCDDGKGCTSDSCDAKTGACSATIAANGAPCSDGNPCTSADACQGGACKGSAKSCDDGNPCSIDSCQAVNGACAHASAADGFTCVDDDPCTLVGTCKAGTCASKDVCTYEKLLDDSFPCGANAGWTFAPAAAEPVVAWHIDNSPAFVTAKSGGCTLNFNNGKNFVAADGGAVQGAATSKTVSLPQTGKAVLRFWSHFDGEGDPNFDKIFVYISADGFTKAVEVIAVDKGLLKTWNAIALPLDKWLGQKIAVRFAFDSVDGVANIGQGWFIDDVVIEVGVGAAAKSCAGRCGPVNPLASCQCNAKCVDTNDCCADFQPLCTGCKQASDCSDGNDCTTDTCDAGSGACQNSVVADKTACDDGSVCTTAETCLAGVCGGGKAKACDDGNPCTFDACDAGSGCKATAGPGACDDGDACTASDACSNGDCKGGLKSCDDKDSCTTDTCDAGSGLCNSSKKADGALCSDGDLCTAGDACASGACQGAALSCDDAQACTSDSCDGKTGACAHAAVADGGACNDGDACTVGAACKAGSCVGTDICASVSLFTDSFACGAQGFWSLAPAAKDVTDSAPGVVGWAIDGSPSAVAAKSPACTLNYNNGKDFNNAFGTTVATRVHGSATLKGQVHLPATDGAELVFWSYNDTEWLQAFDKRLVEISNDNFVAAVESVQLDNSKDQNEWHQERIDLRRWIGKAVRVRFRFDSVDGSANAGKGWFIDDVGLRSRNKPACKAAADCGDSDGCATWACEAGTCVGKAPKADGAACSDGDGCSGDDACAKGVCVGKAKACDDGKPCTWDGCNPANGACFAVTASDGTSCGDGKQCGAGACQAAAP